MIPTLKARAAQQAESLRDTIISISRFVYEHPELGYEEFKSSAYLIDIMKKYGFRVEAPYAGMNTAFRAEYGPEDAPAVAFLAEYDALPGYGEDGAPGHACGHNWISASCVGAAITLAALEDDLPGRIVLLGTPAEETDGGKIPMVEKGVFNDIDMTMQFHLDSKTVLNVPTLAMDAWEFTFHGKAAHAAAFPQDGINALDAVNLTFAGINALRQHILSDSRIHGIISQGGDAPNIVPDHAVCRFYVRNSKRTYLNELSEKVINCARGAALMTGTSMEYRRFENPFDEILPNAPLLAAMRNNLEEAGFTDIMENENSPGSSDVGNVSQVVPTIACNIATGYTANVHDREFLTSAIGEKTMDNLIRGVQAMAWTAIDFLCNETLFAAATEDFKIKKGQQG